MTTKTDSKLKWISVNEAAFSEKRAKQLAKLREAITTANTLKAEWNAAFIADARKGDQIPAGQTFRIGHVTPWGKFAVSIALVPEKAEKAEKPNTSGFTLKG